ncbi:MAG: hypothetical protein ATN34_04730 [Epulopiscium sp. Nele67-Bin002]|nr:MAG: hypothetical protein ATN34_04730 [Epulopiscium sp. Nele67-Bin002]OON93491.1 MAG: hypothetical protein ATN33_05690 [Epulopiscium sp. Nele67-Bin001]
MKNSKILLSTRIKIIVNILIVVLILFTSSFKVIELWSLTISNSREKVINNAQIAQARFSSWFTEKQTFIADLANDISYHRIYMDIEALEDYLTMAHSKIEDVVDVYAHVHFDQGWAHSTGWVPGPDFDVTTRPWYTGVMESNDLSITDPYIDAVDGALVVAISHPIIGPNGSMVGIVSMGVSLNTLQGIIEDFANDEGLYAFVITGDNDVLMHPKANMLPSSAGMLNLNATLANYSRLFAQGEGIVSNNTSSEGDSAYSAYYGMPNTDWKIILTYPTSYTTEILVTEIIIAICISIVAIAVGNIVISVFVRKYIGPLGKVVLGLQSLSEGNLNIDTSNIARNSFELCKITNALDIVSSNLDKYIKEIAQILHIYSEGDFRAVPSQAYIGDFGQIKTSLIEISERLCTLLSDTSSSTIEVTTAAATISDSAMELANITSSQATLLVNFKDNTSNVASDIISNIEAIDESYVTISDMVKKANNSKVLANDMVDAMSQISSSTREILQIIQSIEDIASQTNLLALNASIESARAGEAGRGFSIVANEVRDLSGKTTDIVQEIYEMIQLNLESVEKGEQMVELTTNALEEIITASNETADSSKFIRDNALRQREALKQIVSDTEQLSKDIAKNASISQENVAISEHLAAQADNLQAQMDFFTVD